MEHIIKREKSTAGRHLAGIRGALRGTREGLGPGVRAALSKHGQAPIVELKVCRRPLQAFITTFLSGVRAISGDAYKQPVDRLFHLFMICRIYTGEQFQLEKNQQIDLGPYSQRPNEETRTVQLPVYKGMTELLATAIRAVGIRRLSTYDAFNSNDQSGNCQRFVLDVLNANNVPVSPEVKHFILQPVSELAPSWAQKLTRGVTNFANRAQMALEGKGRKGRGSRSQSGGKAFYIIV